MRYPKWLLDAKDEFYNAIRRPEFTDQIAAYLATLGPKYPRTLAQLIERSQQFTATRGDGTGPNPSRWTLFKREVESGTMEDYRYTTVRDHGLPLVRAVVEGLLTSQRLDAIVYPTSSRRPGLIADPASAPPRARRNPRAMGLGATNIANLTGFPDLIVPAGFTGDQLPVGLSFLGPAFSEAKLLALGYSFEQTTQARRRPVTTPALAGDAINIP